MFKKEKKKKKKKKIVNIELWTESETFDDGEIYNYLYLNPNYFKDTPDYIEKYDKMLKKFKKEIDIYVNNLG